MEVIYSVSWYFALIFSRIPPPSVEEVIMASMNRKRVHSPKAVPTIVARLLRCFVAEVGSTIVMSGEGKVKSLFTKNFTKNFIPQNSGGRA